ncbi:MAG: lipoprotein [Chitinophagales bacterium]|nr:MAG: lipoprotein [Chitinophagales bacterium]
MIKHSLAILLALWVCPAISQPASLLWEIHAPHLSAPSYLYGTIHTRDQRVHDFPDSVMIKFHACNAVAVEVLTSALMDNPFSLIELITMQDTTLDMLLSEEDYKKVKDYASSHLGMYAGVIDYIMPVFTASLFMKQSMQRDVLFTMDAFFEQQATEEGKKLIGLESVEEQLNALKAISLKDQARMLVAQMDDTGEDSLMLEKLMRYYLQQDLEALYELYREAEYPDRFNEALVVQRNLRMAERIDSIISMQPTFIAVGALHLPGENGLIALLRKMAYQLRPVYTQP